ncbi:MAG: FAD-binding protein [candidate division Zixibacteria bacterium]|nr:FAD-binding protein [candidate division Zixibacteria bacterium]
MHISRDRATLTAYASDGSIYAVAPQAVVHIRTVDDIHDALNEARRNNLTVTPRGGGTGLAGGALGPGLILDFSDFRKIEMIDPEHRLVRTRVGIIYDELNLALKPYGLFFPPDPSSGDSCQIGGMLANNSSGPRSVKYGLTSHFVEELEIVTASGKYLNLQALPIDSPALAVFFADNPEFREAFALIESQAELIQSRWPRLKKNSAGYNLKQVVDDIKRGVCNLPALLVGSEGTLGLIATATLRLLPLPEETLTARTYFSSLVDAGRAVVPVLATGPCGLEIVDGATLNLIGRDRFGIPANAGAMLLMEFDDHISERRAAFEALAKQLNLSAPVEFAADPETASALWSARKAIVPTLYRHHPTKRPVSIIEDVSIPPEKIPSFIEYLTDLFQNYHLTFGVFGHIGDGNLHIRPLFDLNDPNDFDLARQLYDSVYERVIDIGGSSTAEHADGRLRAPVLKRVYGDDIYALFVQIKQALDPDGILSPECVLADISFTDNIDYEKIKSYCAACGKCNGYCPAYDIFRREDYSPRGWLRLLNQSGLSHDELNAYLSYCLNCKSCTTVCPAGVDIASEILKHRAKAPSRTSQLAIAFTDNEALLGLSLKMGRLMNPISSSRLGRLALSIPGKPLFGIDRTLSLPVPAAKSLRQRHPDRLAESGTVAFFHGCADNLLDSKTGEALFAVFDHLGIDIKMPPQKCCGLPQEVYGHRGNLIEKAKSNIDSLRKFDAVVVSCASCLLRLKEYAELFRGDAEYGPAANELAGKCYDISQYLNLQKIDFSAFDGDEPIRVTYHHPCHLRAAGLHKEPERLLAKIGHVEICHVAYADRCCAQAGSYGYFHYQESRRMFRKKRDAYKRIEADYLMTSCPSCQMKISAETEHRFAVVHPIHILAERLAKNTGC